MYAPPVTQHEITLLVERIRAAATQGLLLTDDSLLRCAQQQVLPVVRMRYDR
jgi:hypothetical protein